MSKQYAIGVPLIVTLHDDNTVTFETDLSDVTDTGGEDVGGMTEAELALVEGAAFRLSFQTVQTVNPSNDARAFLEQNTLCAADLTEDDIEAVIFYAEHHCGGASVLARAGLGHRAIKMHDSWGPDENVVVHIYETDGDDPDDEVYPFTSGHEALAFFLSLDRA